MIFKNMKTSWASRLLNKNFLFKDAQYSSPMMSGPLVDRVIETVRMMLDRGAPIEYDFIGFNKTHYSDPLLRSIGQMPLGSSLSVSDMGHATRALMIYNRRQVPHASELRQQFEQESQSLLRKNAPVRSTSPNTSGNLVVEVLGKDRDGRIKIYIPESEIRISANLLNTYIRAKAQELGMRQEANGFGKMDYPLFSIYRKPKTEPNAISIRPDFIPALMAALEQYNNNSKTICAKRKIHYATYDYSSLSQIDTTTTTTPSTGVTIKKVEVVGVQSGEISVKFPYDASTVTRIKAIPARNRGFDPVTKAWTFRNMQETRDILSSVLPEISELNLPDSYFYKNILKWVFPEDKYDLSDVWAALETMPNTPKQDGLSRSSPAGQTKSVRATNISKTTAYHIGISINNNSEMKELIKFAFPEYNKDRFVDTNTWTYHIKGSYADYYAFAGILKGLGYDTTSFRQVFMELVRDKIIQPEHIDGRLDGRNPDSEESIAKFNETIKSSLQPGISLYPKQYDGVRHLYSRKSSLLGDETGAGKCQIGTTRININNCVCTLEDVWKTYATRVVIPEGLPSEEWADTTEELFIHSINDNLQVQSSRIINLFRQKYKGKLRKIITSNGRQSITTFEHKFLTPFGWSNNIEINSVIASCCDLPKINIDTQSKTNQEINEFFAEFIAWQLSEGHESNYDKHKRYSVYITQDNIAQLCYLKTIFNNYINPILKKPATLKIKKYNHNSPYLAITSKAYYNLLNKIGYKCGQKSKTKQIPDIIMKSSDQCIIRFLRAFADAEGEFSDNAIYITTKSRFMSYQISQLLSRFGIFHSISKKRKCATNGSRIKRRYFSVNIIGTGTEKFIKLIGAKYIAKFNKLKDFKSQNPNKEGKPLHQILMPFFSRHDIPFRLLDIPSKNYICGKRFAGNDIIDKIITGFRKLLSGQIKQDYAILGRSKWSDKTTATLCSVDNDEIAEVISQLELLKESSLNYEKVIHIEEIEFDGYVYDLSIENTHNYISEELITHNTLQLISAANEILKKHGGQALIVTLKATQLQWQREITKFLGPDELMVEYPVPNAKWTVLYYHMFSNPHMRDRMVEHIKQIPYTVLILDEIHNVKNDSIRTNKIMEFTDRIPFKWGASATISANRPMDVHRQLKAVGHRLGNLSEGQFKKEFAGMVPGGFRGAYVLGTLEQQREAAEKLRKWLALSGVYIRRTKKDMNPNLPIHTIEDLPVELTESQMQHLNISVLRRLKEYKDPDMAISQMIAERTELAKIKVPYTLDLAKSILAEGKKILIFTCFVDAAKALEAGLKKITEDEVLSIMGGDSNRQQKVDAFKSNPNIKALVLSIIVGGAGLDLPNVVDDVLMNDFSWTPKDAEQAEGRAFRITSTNNVCTRYIIAAGTGDEVFYETVQQKIKLAKIVQDIDQEYADKVRKGLPVDDLIQKRRQIENQIDNINNSIPGKLQALHSK